MDIKVVNFENVKFPPEALQEPFPAYALQVRSGHFSWNLVRTFPQIEHFSIEAAKLVKDAPKIPPRQVDENTKAAMSEYFSAIAAKEEVEALIQERLISTENPFAECDLLPNGASLSGPLNLVEKKKTDFRWASLRDDTLYLFDERVYNDAKPRTLPRASIPLLGGTINPQGDNQFEIVTAFGNSTILQASSAAERDSWVEKLRNNINHSESSGAKALTPAQQGKLNSLKALLGPDFESDPQYDDKALTRFLLEHQWNVDAVKLLVGSDREWRCDMNIKNLKMISIYDTYKSAKCFYVGGRDRTGRPIIVFKAAKHDSSADFLETLKLVVYNCERAVEDLGSGEVQEAVLIYDLNGFERKHTDNRTIKLLLEMVQAHYPSRIGLLLAIHANWLFRLVFKVIRPWLSEDLVSKVHIYGDASSINKWIAPDQMPKEYGGTSNYDLNDFINRRLEIEGVGLDALKTPAAEHQFANDEIVARYSDCPTEKTIKGAVHHGWLKKQAGWGQRFNKRYCVLKGSVLYYYLDKKDPRADGTVPLRGATFIPDRLNFHIITSGGKDCVFSADKKDKDVWFGHLQEAVVKLGGTVKEPLNSAEQEEEDWFQVLNAAAFKGATGRPEVVVELLARLKAIVAQHVAPGGSLDAARESPEFKDFEEAAAELQKIDPLKLSESAQIAFFVNLHSLLLVHAQIKIGHPNDPEKRYFFFYSPSYNVGGSILSLYDISHGILRGNISYPSRLGWTKHFVNKKDARLKLVQKTPNPLVHFALHANLWTDPLDYVLKADDLDGQLKHAARSFQTSNVEVSDSGVPVISPLFEWYSNDFGKTNAEVQNFAAQYLDEPRASAVKSAPFVYYKSYDWNTIGLARLLQNP